MTVHVTSRKPEIDNRQARLLEFAKRLQRAQLDKGMTQAELARASGLGEDSISGYVRGRTLPRPAQLQKLCKVLGVERDALLPPQPVEEIASHRKPSLDFKDLGDGRAWLFLNQAVDFSTGLKIMQLLNDQYGELKRKTG
jgi:transcriptional regulator with XRE-family HTH domain